MANGTSERILDAASRLFLQYGYKRTTVDDIAVEAGVAKGSVYIHFDSKDAIFGTASRRLCRRVMDEMLSLASDDGSVQQRLNNMLLSSSLYVWDFCHQAPHAPELWAEVIAAASKYALEAYAEARTILARVIAEGQANGELTTDFTPEALAGLLQMALQGFDPPFMLVQSREQIQTQVPQLVGLLIHGMSARTDGTDGDTHAH